jgi:hypothetical protein
MVEVKRALRPEEAARAEVQAIFARIHVEAVDGAAADLAVNCFNRETSKRMSVRYVLALL